MTAETLEAGLAFGPSIRQFEALDIQPEDFDHEAHLYVAWQYLAEMELLAAIDRYRRALRRLVVKLGIPEKYHETITWLYIIAVAERHQARSGDDWPSFKAANADLFERGGAFVRRYYSEGAIDSPVARNHFILPDRQGPATSV